MIMVVVARTFVAMVMFTLLDLRAFGEMVLLHLLPIKDARVIAAVEIDIRPGEEMIREQAPAVAEHVAHDSSALTFIAGLHARTNPRRQAEATDEQQNER